VKEDILGYLIDAGSVHECAQSVMDCVGLPYGLVWLACMNPHSYAVSLHDGQFAAALRDADWLIPDGVGVVLASRVFKRHVRERVSGPDLFHAVQQMLNRAGGYRVFFLGSTSETLARIESRMRADYPAIKVAGTFSPPFRPWFSSDELEQMIRAVNAAEADVLWVGLTAPKQEKWIFENKGRLKVRFIGAIGAAFDFYAGNLRPTPWFFRKLGLEWLPRLIQQPRRLWRRTFQSAPIFLWHVVRARLSGSDPRPS